jgi:hypothetical protein
MFLNDVFSLCFGRHPPEEKCYLFVFQSLERINFEKVYPLCKDLQANPCHEMLVGELGSPLSKHFKVKMF